MKNFQVFIACSLVLFQLMQTNGAPRRKRWIPQRYSDDEYGNDAGFVPSGPTYGSASAPNNVPNPNQNYLSYYWPEYFSSPRREESYGDYSGMFRANANPAHVMVDPVQQLQNVQAYSYVQNYAPNPQLMGYDPYGRAHSSEHGGVHVSHEGADGRAKLLQVLLGGSSQNQNTQQDRLAHFSAAPAQQTDFFVVNQPSSSSFAFPAHQQQHFGTLADVNLLSNPNSQIFDTNSDILNILANNPQFANSDFSFQSSHNNPFSVQSSPFSDNPLDISVLNGGFTNQQLVAPNQFSLSHSGLNDGNIVVLSPGQVSALPLTQKHEHSSALSSPAALRILLDQQQKQQTAEANLFAAVQNEAETNNDGKKKIVFGDQQHTNQNILEAIVNEKLEESQHSSPHETKVLAIVGSENSHVKHHPQNILSTGVQDHSLHTNAELEAALEKILENKIEAAQSSHQKPLKIQKHEQKVLAQAFGSGLQQHADTKKQQAKTNQVALALAIQMAQQNHNEAKAQQTLHALEALALEQQKEAEKVKLEENILTIEHNEKEANLAAAIESLKESNDANVEAENEAFVAAAIEDINEQENIKEAEKDLENQHQSNPLVLLTLGARAKDDYNIPSYQDTSVPTSPLDTVYPGVSQAVSVPSRGPLGNYNYQYQPQYTPTPYAQSTPVYDFPQQYSFPYNNPVSNYGQVVQPVRYGYGTLPVSSNMYAPYAGQGVTAPAYNNNGYYAIPRVTRNSVMLQSQPQPVVRLVYGVPQPQAPNVFG